MTTAPLLIEIGTEEMPPLKLQSFQRSFQDSIERALKDTKLDFSTIKTFVTPRRLAILIDDLSDTQPDQIIERKGPLATSPAAIGFLHSLNITAADCQHQETPKGTFLIYRTTQPGQTITQLLQKIVEQALFKLPIPKPMRWGAHAHAFIRPVHWLVALHGGHILPLSLFGKTADRYTYGHRFHAPDPICLTQASEYKTVLYKHCVIADYQKRQDSIVSQIHTLAGHIDATAIIDPVVLQEVTGLVEWPVALIASFDPIFLSLPKEVSICSMQTHQRYFPLQNTTGDLIEHFVVISNIESTMPELIKQGNERVIQARLSDAAYFYEQDSKQPLETQFDHLNKIIFQTQLGDYQAKTIRITAIATFLATQCKVPLDIIRRAGHLSKCDLLTQMVYEFPELQGTMGYYYALNQQEPLEVATAIQEHYLPRFATDTLPESMPGTLLALADRLDSVVGLFGIGLFPTGTKDPYALRRQAIAIIRLCIEKQLDVTFSDLCSLATKQYGSLLQEKHLTSLLPFFQERLKVYLQDTHDAAFDQIDAVMAVQPDHPLDILHRIEALRLFARCAEAPHLAAAHKRVHNILTKNPTPAIAMIDPALFECTAERTLYEHLQTLDLTSFDYVKKLSQLATLQKPVDAFFTEVMVMTDDLNLRNNRLALLKQLDHVFSAVADLARLQS